MTPGKKLLLQFAFALGIVNFIAFFAISVMIGGDALNGKIVNGHYFLGSHGHFTEVSANVFDYSAWHARSLIITHPLAIFAAYLWSRDRKKSGTS